MCWRWSRVHGSENWLHGGRVCPLLLCQVGGLVGEGECLSATGREAVCLVVSIDNKHVLSETKCMQQASQHGATDLLREATELAQQAQDLCSSAADRKTPDAVVTGLDELTVKLRHLRDGIHDAALNPDDELAEPRLEQ